jgi:hypothetical protein
MRAPRDGLRNVARSSSSCSRAAQEREKSLLPGAIDRSRVPNWTKRAETRILVSGTRASGFVGFPL